MSRSAKVEGVFADGAHSFRLRIGELEELQEKCDAGPEEIWLRLQGYSWRLADIRETLRLGLIGAGMLPTQALVLVDRYCTPGWLAEWKTLAASVVGAALYGAPDEDKQGPDASGEQTGATATSPDENSGSPSSTNLEAPSD